jgi:hypothetical protein
LRNCPAFRSRNELLANATSLVFAGDNQCTYFRIAVARHQLHTVDMGHADDRRVQFGDPYLMIGPLTKCRESGDDLCFRGFISERRQ